GFERTGGGGRITRGFSRSHAPLAPFLRPKRKLLRQGPAPVRAGSATISTRAASITPVSSTHFAIDVPDSLIARLRRSDARAFEQVYRLFERPVYTLARRMLDDEHEAQDVLHETMLSVIDKLQQFRGSAPFWGWLRQIAVNAVLMRLRK